MQTILTIVLSGLLIAGGDDAVQKDLDALQGTWKVVAAETSGKKAEDASLTEARIDFDGTTVRVKGVQEQEFRDQVNLDPGHSPKHIDAILTVGPDKGETVRGLYKIEGNTATFCWAAPRQPRPETFSTGQGHGERLLVVEKSEE